MGSVYPQHLKSKSEEEMFGVRQRDVSGVVMEGWGAWWLRGHGALPSPPPSLTNTLILNTVPNLIPMSQSNLSPRLEGQPMTHCTVDFGVSGRPSSACLTLTPTTAAAVTCLPWGGRDDRLTAQYWHHHNRVLERHMLELVIGVWLSPAGSCGEVRMTAVWSFMWDSANW